MSRLHTNLEASNFVLDRLFSLEGILLLLPTTVSLQARIDAITTNLDMLPQLPRLYHMAVALPHFKQWTVPEKFSALLAYMKLADEHPAFKATDYGADMIIKGWLGHGLSPP